jgi:GntR family transcriptional regulator
MSLDFSLDGSSPTPLYLQLADRLRQFIRAGHWRPGEAVPGEREMAERADVSRVTVRKAIEDLVKDGLLVQRQGAGTFVAGRFEQPLSVLAGFSEDMQARGLRPGSKWLEKRLARPTPEEAMALGLSPDERVVRLTRVRTADGKPLALEKATVSERYLPSPDLVTVSLYDALKIRGIRAVRALQRLRADVASPEEIRLLALTPGSAILHIERRAYMADGSPLEFTRSAYRADQYDFVAELRVDLSEERS